MSGAVFVPDHSWQPQGLSRADSLKASGKARAFYDSLSDAAKSALKYKWDFWARPAQLMPPPSVVPHRLGWKFWVLLAGRGFGKTRVAAETVRALVEAGTVKRIALVGPTHRDVEQTMINGESGIMSVFPPNGPIKLRYVGGNKKILYFYRDRKLVTEAFVYTGEKPDRMRGPNIDFAWFDELGAFQYLNEAWLMFIATHRLPPNPRAIFTTTPRSNLLQIDGLLNHERTVTTFGKSSDNKNNLAPDTIETLESVYKDTDFASQELGGALRLDDLGSLFKSDWINKFRVDPSSVKKTAGQVFVNGVPILKFAVTVDPSGSSKDTACECGITVAGLGADGNAYLFADLSKRTTPENWARIAIMASSEWPTSVIVYEKNFGDEMVGDLIRSVAKDMGTKVTCVAVEAVSDKVKRAMLVSPLVQKGKFRLVGYFGQLERQLTTWQPGTGSSPDRLDSFVWAGIHLLLKQAPRGMVG